jgi:hypothetical protein
MAQGSSGAALITAALILGGSLVGGSYLLAEAIDRAAGEVAILDASLKSAMETAKEIAKATAKPPARAAAQRPDPKKARKIEVGSAPVKGPESAPVTIVEWVDFQ